MVSKARDERVYVLDLFDGDVLVDVERLEDVEALESRGEFRSEDPIEDL